MMQSAFQFQQVNKTPVSTNALAANAYKVFIRNASLAYWRQARSHAAEPVDQKLIPHPRLGFYGVMDEHIDWDLLNAIAAAHPEWHLVLVGPITNLDLDVLPQYPNIHYLGARPAQDLPAYLSGWDVALLPFLPGESPYLVSLEKVIEYLASGQLVVSTPLTEVLCPFGEQGLVWIAGTANKFIAALDSALALAKDPARAYWLQRVDSFLAQGSRAEGRSASYAHPA